MLLAVVGMTMAAALGYALIEQSNAQSSLAISREDNRRLDYAAEALTKNLIDVAPFNVLIAPVGKTDQAYNQLPDNLGVITSNTKGIPFSYCPFAALRTLNETPFIVDQIPLIPSDLKTEKTIKFNGTYFAEYSATIYAGGVIAQNYIPASLIPLNPIGIIVSAGSNSTRPPSCFDVKYENGKVTVPGGIARVISLPSSATSTKNALKTQVKFYASQNGSGNKSGENESNTAAMEGLWALLAKTKPAVALIYVVGTVETGNNFKNYVIWAPIFFTTLSTNSH